MVWGLSLSAQGYLCAPISGTPFHTGHASFPQQSMGLRGAVKSPGGERDSPSPRKNLEDALQLHTWMEGVLAWHHLGFILSDRAGNLDLLSIVLHCLAIQMHHSTESF